MNEQLDWLKKEAEKMFKPPDGKPHSVTNNKA